MRKHTLPRFSGARGKIVRRDPFLDGTQRTYFAPGQAPYMIGTLDPLFIPGQVINNLGSPATQDNYNPPTQWDTKNNLLRPVQQVWLEIRIGTAGALGFSGDPLVFQWEDSSQDPAEFVYDVQPNIGRAEHLRLALIFKSVKTAIEILRPGRTFVRVCDWCEEENISREFFFDSQSPLVTDWTCKIDNIPTSRVSQSSGSGFIEAPASTLNYLGTDFLQIYCGDSIIQYLSMNREKTEPIPHFGLDGAAIPVDVSSDVFFSYVYNNRLKPNIKKFFNYSSQLYHPPDNYTLWVPHADSAFDAGNIDNAGMTLYQQSKVNFDRVAAVASGDRIDITHPGESTLIADVTYLIKLIASHYGFNPDTGKDL